VKKQIDLLIKDDTTSSKIIQNLKFKKLCRYNNMLRRGDFINKNVEEVDQFTIGDRNIPSKIKNKLDAKIRNQKLLENDRHQKIMGLQRNDLIKSKK
tara:strand:+ start:112 stop:402 length:291 start_codon:yes stop_codon:yes gene_type:complete